MNVLESKSRNRQRVLNPRVACLVAVVLTIAVYGSRKLHDRQFGRTLDFLRQSAYASLESKDFRKAHVQFSQYLTLRSSDLDAREKLSSLLSTHIQTRPALEQAFRINEELLRNELPQVELRSEQAKIAVRLGKYSDAEAHLRLLRIACEDSGEIWYLSGHCASKQRRTSEAARFYQRSMDCPNPQEQAFDELATLATTNPQLLLEPADILDQMVTTCKSAEAYRLRATQLVQNHDLLSALPDVWNGLAISPDDVALNSLLTYCLQSDSATNMSDESIDGSNDLTRAIHQLQECVERNPLEISFRVHLSALLWKDHQQSAAIQVLEVGISRDARAFQLQSTLIEYLLTQEELDKAERLLSGLPATALPKAEREFLTGRIQLLRRDWKSADRSLQQAAAWSKPDSSLQLRAKMLLAMCRSNSDNPTKAVDAFRAVLATNPDSVAGQMGLASAWMKADRTDLAIAEYKHLLNEPGVPAYLTDLLIQRNLKQPAVQRNWNEVADLVRDQDPFITDPVQRTLLQADMLMASGRIMQAISLLENAVTANPSNVILQRALARLNGEQNGPLQDRLKQLAHDDPKNYEVLAALVRLELGANQAQSALTMLDDIAAGHHGTKLTPVESVTLAIQTSETVTALETQFGRTQYADLIREATLGYAYQLFKIDSIHQPTLVRVLAEQGRLSEALRHIRFIDKSQNLATKASALRALAQYASPRPDVLPDVTQELFTMIDAVPNNTALRICYADVLLYGDFSETAAQVLRQIQDAPPDDGEVRARLAWILAVTSDDSKQARDLIDYALQLQPENPAFRVIEGRVLLSAGRFQDALDTLSGINEQYLSQAAITYRAAALLELEQTEQAWRAVQEIRSGHVLDPMFPADERLLATIKERLKQLTTALRTQPSGVD